MLKLCGFAVSNYFNKVKIALLEKGVPFEEELVYTTDKDLLAGRSPMGKVPFIQTAAGSLSESQVICDYLDEAYPANPLYPADPFARAKARELCTVIEMHLELHARRLYAETFFGGTVTDQTKEQVKKDLARGVQALSGLAKWAPFIAGDKLTYADCAAYVSLPLVSMASKKIYGEDALASVPQMREYLGMLKARPHMMAVEADRKINQQQMAERAKK